MTSFLDEPWDLDAVSVKITKVCLQDPAGPRTTNYCMREYFNLHEIALCASAGCWAPCAGVNREGKGDACVEGRLREDPVGGDKSLGDLRALRSGRSIGEVTRVVIKLWACLGGATCRIVI